MRKIKLEDDGRLERLPFFVVLALIIVGSGIGIALAILFTT